MMETKEDEMYPIYDECQNCEQDSYYDDANVMYELVRQFVESIDGSETKDELLKLISEGVENIHKQATLMSKDWIRQEIMDRLPDNIAKLIDL